MTLGGLELCCPWCRGSLAAAAERDELACEQCRRRYPVVLGIPDLRIFPDPYIDMAADRAKGLRLAERFGDFDFAGLVEYYYSITPAVPDAHARRYARGLLAAEGRAEAALRAWGNAPQPAGGNLLDIGCGTAPFAAVAARSFRAVIGVDIAFRWLVVGKKRLMERGVEVPLVCACAEALPFRDQQFDAAVAESVLEHVGDQRATLCEASRVLRPRGALFASTPNRFSLGPDPQVGLWAGGFLPRRLVDRHVRRMGGVPPKRHLLSRPALARLLRETGFDGARIFLPDIADAQRSQFSPATRTVISAYQVAKHLPGASAALGWLGPMFYVRGENRRSERNGRWAE